MTRPNRGALRGSLRGTGAFLGASALLALAGCGGGGGGSNDGTSNSTNANANLPSVNLTALTNNNRLVSFNSRTPRTSTIATITGLTAGDTLRAIDFRFTPPTGTAGTNNGLTGLYGIAQNGTSLQLYRLVTSGTTATATRVGTRFDLIPTSPTPMAFGFDFNPTVDRIRLTEATGNRDLRLNPNVDDNTSPVVDSDPNAAGTQPDGVIAYDASDANNGKDPDAVGAAYTNVDADTTTGTTLYVLDSKNDTLAIQGRGTTGSTDFVSPNAGNLFTVANLGLNLQADSGFDISPSSNAAFVSNGNSIYGISLATGAVTGGANVSGLGVTLIGLAATS